jgi:hypothetical protein
MGADKLFLAEMDGEVVATSLLAFKQTLSLKKTIVDQVKTEKDSPTFCTSHHINSQHLNIF